VGGNVTIDLPTVPRSCVCPTLCTPCVSGTSLDLTAAHSRTSGNAGRILRETVLEAVRGSVVFKFEGLALFIAGAFVAN
jgi:hypothetical protein